MEYVLSGMQNHIQCIPFSSLSPPPSSLLPPPSSLLPLLPPPSSLLPPPSSLLPPPSSLLLFFHLTHEGSRGEVSHSPSHNHSSTTSIKSPLFSTLRYGMFSIPLSFSPPLSLSLLFPLPLSLPLSLSPFYCISNSLNTRSGRGSFFDVQRVLSSEEDFKQWDTLRY